MKNTKKIKKTWYGTQKAGTIRTRKINNKTSGVHLEHCVEWVVGVSNDVWLNEVC
jgi:hypothetical protein